MISSATKSNMEELTDGALVEADVAGDGVYVPAKIQTTKDRSGRIAILLFSTGRVVEVPPYRLRKLAMGSIDDLLLKPVNTDGDFSKENFRQQQASEEWVTCPFDKNHRMPRSTFQKHIANCRVVHYDPTRQKTCPFNYQHVIPINDFDEHILTCVDKPSDVVMVDYGFGPVPVARANPKKPDLAERYKYFQDVGAGKTPLPQELPPQVDNICEVCNKQFDTWISLKQHRSSKHGLTAEKPNIQYGCDSCSKTFATLSDKEQHHSQVHVSRPVVDVSATNGTWSSPNAAPARPARPSRPPPASFQSSSPQMSAFSSTPTQRPRPVLPAQTQQTSTASLQSPAYQDHRNPSSFGFRPTPSPRPRLSSPPEVQFNDSQPSKNLKEILNDVFVRLRNVPRGVSEADIMTLFQQFELTPIGIQLVVLSNQPTCDVFVEFSSSNEARRALVVHGCNFGNYKIVAVRASLSQAKEALEQSLPPQLESTYRSLVASLDAIDLSMIEPYQAF